MIDKLLGRAGGMSPEELRRTQPSRSIRIHSHAPQPPGAQPGREEFIRVAFEFLDPPGPWSLQFYEAAPAQAAVLSKLAPGAVARYYESRDGARTRLIETEESEVLRPR